MQMEKTIIKYLHLESVQNLKTQEKKEKKKMKSYKNYLKTCIGFSDYAALVLVGAGGENGIQTQPLYFNYDGQYWAYIVPEDTRIGGHYRKVAEFKHWLKIYDDTSLMYSVNAAKIIVYRAGDAGCIIQLINN